MPGKDVKVDAVLTLEKVLFYYCRFTHTEMRVTFLREALLLLQIPIHYKDGLNNHI